MLFSSGLSRSDSSSTTCSTEFISNSALVYCESDDSVVTDAGIVVVGVVAADLFLLAAFLRF